MSVDSIFEAMRAGLAGRTFEGSLKLDCGEDGVIVLDNGDVTREDRAADCTIRLSAENLAKLIAGKLNPMTGVMMGKLKVSGDAGVAMRLGGLLKG